jgi:hypothetical protein
MKENYGFFIFIGIIAIYSYFQFVLPWWNSKYGIKRKLRKQSNLKNSEDLKNVLKELNDASLKGEYEMTAQLKANQVSYVKSIGLNVEETKRIGYYKISW